MGLYDVGQNFNPGTGPSFNTRGAYSFVPAEGSSNILGGGMQGPMAGKFGSVFQQIMGSEKPIETAAAYAIAQNSDPEYQKQLRKQQLEDAAAFYKEQGDQQMKYNLVNRGLTALQTGLERGLTKYQDPYTIANMLANGYAEGARSSSGLAQIGAGIPSRQYYNV